MVVDAHFDATSEVATGDVTFERQGVSQRFVIRERYFARDEIGRGAGGGGVRHRAGRGLVTLPRRRPGKGLVVGPPSLMGP
jgi:hypothetical protein